MKPHATSVAALVLILGLPVVLTAQTPEQNPPPTTTAQPATATAPAPVAEAVPSCSDCHDEGKVFRTNPHARGATLTNGVVANDVCATCHGDGTEHIQAGGDKTKIAKPAGRAGSDDVCMLCHDATTDRISRHGGMHANSETVNCLTCHSIHHPDPRSPHLVAKPQLVLCGSCHTQAAGFESKPYKHRLGRGGMECSSCHEPHGRPSSSVRSMAMLDPLRTTRAGEAPCLNCHADKRGPWVFSHGANAVGDCVSCHEVHGSSNPKQLKRANVWQLCIECHSPISNDTLGSQPPSFHNLSSPRYRNCTTCHVAIHGSNRDPQLLK
jgi:DmsE family decaheme c-type cytochrome